MRTKLEIKKELAEMKLAPECDHRNGFIWALEWVLQGFDQNKKPIASDAVLSEVRAIEKALDIMDELIKYHAHYCDVEMTEENVIREKAIRAINKISEHFR